MMHGLVERSFPLREAPTSESPTRPVTVATILEERLLRGSTVLANESALGSHVHWVRPVTDALGDGDRLDQVVVTGDEQDLGPATVLALSRRGAAALLVRNASAERWVEHPPPTGLPVVGLPPQVRSDVLAGSTAFASG